MPATPRAEVEVSDGLVRQLIADQHADLAELPIARGEAGWDNFMFRLGSSLAVRMPRRELGARLIENEQRWLPTLAGGLPLPVPSPIRVGLPGRGYPWRWSIVPWLVGRSANLAPPDAGQAVPLARFLLALHRPAPADAPVNPARGVPIAQRAGDSNRLSQLRDKTSAITPAVERAWQEGLRAAPTTGKVWLHGDLHPRNVLVCDGAITGIIDWGDMSGGDPAVDLASVWMLLADAGAREVALQHYGASAETIARAKAWAVLFGVVLLENGLVDNPAHAAIGEATLGRITEDQKLATKG